MLLTAGVIRDQPPRAHGAFNPVRALEWWDLQTGQRLAEVRFPTDGFTVAFTPDGNQLVMVGRDRIRRWGLSLGIRRVLHTLRLLHRLLPDAFSGRARDQ